MNQNGDRAVTIPSRAIGVWRRLYSRYSLEPYPASVAPDVSKTIQPVTQADELLRESQVRSETSLIIVDTVLVVTVPTGERWKLYHLRADRTGGDRNIDRILIGSTEASLIVDDFTAAGSRNFEPQTPYPMQEGWRILVRGTGGATDGNWAFGLMIDVENVFLSL